MRVLILAGPTAVGKSELGLALAERLGAEILCADSMQVYKYLDVGTAKPTAAERARIPHHLLDLVYPDEPFSAARYVQEFEQARAAVAARGRLPLLVGGTGLYIRAAVRPFLFPEAGRRPEVRARLNAEAQEAPGALYERLKNVDPEAARRIHRHDLRRLVRALEVFETTGRPISELQRARAMPEKDGEPLFVCLTRDRAELYGRIEARTDAMMAMGFLDEVRSLAARGYGRGLPSLQGLGYRELYAYLHGECSLADAVAEIKRRTRNYAKRQLTWFRREAGTIWFDLSALPAEKVLEEILRLLAGRWEGPSNKN
ncbi:MAG: tRNA (adenosine(37)-N6)-dimethylallyltransferase MiaA [Patescibacteria group bacterium]